MLRDHEFHYCHECLLGVCLVAVTQKYYETQVLVQDPSSFDNEGEYLAVCNAAQLLYNIKPQINLFAQQFPRQIQNELYREARTIMKKCNSYS